MEPAPASRGGRRIPDVPGHPVPDPQCAQSQRMAARARAASRFDERVRVEHTPGVGLPGATAALYRRVWMRLLGDGPDESQRWHRRLRWDGWDEAAVTAAFERPIDIAGLAQHLGRLQRVFGFLRADGRPDWERWARQVFDEALPRADADQRAALLPLQQALAQRFAEVAPVLESAGATVPGRAAPIEELLDAWPVLARQLSDTWAQAHTQVTKLWQRLHADDAERARVFGAAFGGWPRRVEPADADHHRDGQQVLRLEFAAGALYYKPRSLAIDAAFEAVCRALGQAGLPAPPALAILDRRDYGYQAEACALPSTATLPHDVFEGLGALLALAWLCNARDLHRDNLRLTAEGLVLFDLETFIQPERPVADAYEHGLLANGLLDFRCAVAGVDVAGLHVLEHALGRTLDAGEALRVEEAFRRLLQGVCKPSARHLLAPLLVPGLMLRVVYRPTALYAKVLAALREPRALVDGALSILATDSLHHALLAYPEPPPEWALAAEERRQLERGDVPLFELPAGERRFESSGPDLFVHSANAVLTRRLDALRADQIEGKAQQLRQTLQLRRAQAPSGLASRLSGWVEHPGAAPLLRGFAGELLTAACPVPGEAGVSSAACAALLEQQAATALPDMLDLDGGVAGQLFALAALSLRGVAVPHREAERCVDALLRDGLPAGYSGIAQAGLAHGLAGMALALALAARVFGRPEWQAHVEAWLAAEDALFDPAAANWPAAPGQPPSLNAWCNGASGILLARALIGTGLDTAAARAARMALPSLPAAAVDHLCCGELGRVLAWQAVARVTGDLRLADAGDARFDELQQRWARRNERMDRTPGLGLLRSPRGLAWGWAAYRDSALSNPALLGLRWKDWHD